MKIDINNKIWILSSDFLNKEKLWLLKQIDDIGPQKLIELAKKAAFSRKNSYAPYSNYKVGVALLASSGKIYSGINSERASYSETDHAEESAVTNAVNSGEIKISGRKFIHALAVSHNGDSAPCGRCRQIIIEHCDNAVVITSDTRGEINRITSLKILLPYAFCPSDLGIE